MPILLLQETVESLVQLGLLLAEFSNKPFFVSNVLFFALFFNGVEQAKLEARRGILSLLVHLISHVLIVIQIERLIDILLNDDLLLLRLCNLGHIILILKKEIFFLIVILPHL